MITFPRTLEKSFIWSVSEGCFRDVDDAVKVRQRPPKALPVMCSVTSRSLVRVPRSRRTGSFGAETENVAWLVGSVVRVA